MAHDEKGVIDFLSTQLERKEKEQQRLHNQLVQTHSRNLATLIATWRFIVVSRVAVFAAGTAGLQIITSNISSFLDTAHLIAVLENYKGVLSGLIEKFELWTPRQAAHLVAFLILGIAFTVVSIDSLLALLQSKCAKRGLEAEAYLEIRGLFFEIRNYRLIIGTPFSFARIIFIAIAVVILSYLRQSMS